MCVTLHRVIVNRMNAGPHHALRQVAGQVLAKLGPREHSLLVGHIQLHQVLHVALAELVIFLLLVADDVIHFDHDKVGKICEVDLGPEEGEKLLTVASDRHVGPIIDTIVHIARPVVVVQPPLVEDELLEADEQDGGY